VSGAVLALTVVGFGMLGSLALGIGMGAGAKRGDRTRERAAEEQAADERQELDDLDRRIVAASRRGIAEVFRGAPIWN